MGGILLWCQEISRLVEGLEKLCNSFNGGGARQTSVEVNCQCLFFPFGLW